MTGGHRNDGRVTIGSVHGEMKSGDGQTTTGRRPATAL
jgi:hypothetical protein